jgi:hypothetical protein
MVFNVNQAAVGGFVEEYNCFVCMGQVDKITVNLSDLVNSFV